MPYKDMKDRNHKKEYKDFLANGGRKKATERQRARRMVDKLGIDRDGKAVDHIQKLENGGTTTRSNIRVRDFSENSSDNLKSPKKGNK